MGGFGSGRIGAPLREAQVDEFARLNEWAEALNDSMRLRSNVVLLLLGGMSVAQVSEQLGVNIKTIYSWRKRWNERGIDGLSTRKKRLEDKKEGVTVSMRRMIESLDSTQIDRTDVMALTLQFLRDLPRDGHEDKDRSSDKLRLEGLKLLERLTSRGSDKKADIPDWI